MKRILEGLQILIKYCSNGNGDLSAEHDVIYTSPRNASEVEMNEDDKKKLDELGWFIDEENDCWCHFC